MKRRVLVSLLATLLAWSLCGVGDVHAGSQDDSGDVKDFAYIMLGVAVVISVIIALEKFTADSANADGDEEPGGEILVSVVEPADRAEFRVDPVLTIRKHAVGAGLAFSF